MFNKDIEERLKEIENRLYSGVGNYYPSKFEYSRLIEQLERINNRISANSGAAQKQIQDIKDFLEIEEHKPDCTPYLRKKE